jgi:cholesterol oxidase
VADTRPQISKSHDQLGQKYDILVVGSGYGGAITAARLGQANVENNLGLTIALIERGLEWQPGDFPENQEDVLPATRQAKGQIVNNPLGLFEIRAGGDSDLIIPCGLGGSSLIDSSIMTMPDPRIFEQEGWPDEFRKDMEYGRFQKHFKRAQEVLGQNPRPFHVQMERYNQAAQAAGLLTVNDIKTGCTQANLDYAINFDKTGPDEYGIIQTPCTHCGCCMTGCNVGAKITLVDNYLQMAVKAGVEIFNSTEMRYFTRDKGRYLAHIVKLEEDQQKIDWELTPQLFPVVTKLLVLSAGPIGTSEILLCSKSELKKRKAMSNSLSRLGLDPSAIPKKNSSLRFPSMIGKRVGRNGNAIFAIYNGKNRVDSVGLGLDQAYLDYAVGPTITSALDSSGPLAPLRETINFYDMGFPRATALAFKLAFKRTDAGSKNKSLSDRFSNFRKRLFEKDNITREDSLNYSLAFLTCGHDEQQGTLAFDETGSFFLHWQRLEEQEVHKKALEKAEEFAKNMGGGLITRAAWDFGLGSERPITLHLLGGCNMANNRVHGVVNDYGAVFDPNDDEDPKAVISRLFVVGRETIPTSLGIAPALTVAGVAERSASKIAEKLIDGSLGLGPNAGDDKSSTGPHAPRRPRSNVQP